MAASPESCAQANGAAWIAAKVTSSSSQAMVPAAMRRLCHTVRFRLAVMLAL